MLVKDYKGINAKKEKAVVTEEEILQELEAFRQSATALSVVDRPAALGDTVTLDFEGWCEGEQFEGGTAEAYDLELGSHRFVPGFEDQLVGISAGEARDVNVTFPENYAPNLAGKDAVFKCKVSAVNEKSVPELDDAFAKQYGQVETLTEFKESIRAGLTARAEGVKRSEALDIVMDAIIEANPIELDAEVIEKETKALLAQMITQMSGQQLDAETFCGMAGMEREQLYDMIRPSAEKNAKVKMLVDAIAAQEGIVVTDEEMEKEIAATAQDYGMDLDQMKQYIDMEALKNDFRVQKTLDLIYNASIITEE